MYIHRHKQYAFLTVLDVLLTKVRRNNAFTTADPEAFHNKQPQIEMQVY